jgi:sporulation protein YlmC with PRC-barrel domain
MREETMKRAHQLLLSVAATTLALSPALTAAQYGNQADPGAAAQTPATTRPMSPTSPVDAPRTTPGAKSTPDATSSAPSTKALHDWERGHRGSKIIGTDVRNPKGEKIGDVKDIVLDDKGTVVYAIVSTGGFLGMSDRLHAVPWKALQTNASGKDFFVLDIDKARLATTPGFDSKSWPDFADERWNRENRKHYEK